MQLTAVVLAGFAALASAQTFTGSTVSPTAAAPTGCAATYPGTFEVSVVNVTAAPKAKRQTQTSANSLVISLKNGILTDSQGRIGYIASNYQFQFDAGGQAGQIYNAGFSVCANKTLALGGSAIFYQCLSGNFYNLYDRNWAPQCSPIYLDVIAAASGSASTTVVSQSSAGQSGGTAVSATTTSAAIPSTIADGQVQGGSTSRIVSSVSVITSVRSTTSSAAVVSSIIDGQIQAPTSTSRVVSASTALSTVTSSRAVVSSISDGQIQAPTSTSALVSTSSRAIVSTISDGQIQAPTSTSVRVSTSSRAIVSTIADGQIQAPTSTSVAAYTGGATMPTMAAQVVLAVAGAAIALF